MTPDPTPAVAGESPAPTHRCDRDDPGLTCDEQEPPPEYVPRAWRGTWQTSSDGLWEIRPYVETSEDGFLAGLDLSWQGGDSGEKLACEARATLDLAKADAERLASDWHRVYDAPEETAPDRPRAGS